MSFTNDHLSDFISRVNNAQKSKQYSVRCFNSKFIVSLLNVLIEEGYIRGYTFPDDSKYYIDILLKYYEDTPVIEEFKRISRQGCRYYISARHLKKVKQGLGMHLVSTSKGVMTDRNALFLLICRHNHLFYY